MFLLILGAVWILGFYTPALAPFVYPTRWEASIAFVSIAVLIIVMRGHLRIDSVIIAVGFLLTLLFFSALYSFSPIYTILRSVSAAILLTTTFALCNAIIRTEDHIRHMIWGFLFLYASLLASFYYSSATDEFAFASDRLQANSYFKATGGGNTLVSAGLLGIWVLKFINPRFRPIVLITLLVIAVSIVMTRSRIPIAGLALTWPAALVMFYGGRLNKSIIAILVVSIAAGAYVYTSPEIAKQIRVDESELEQKGYDISTGRFERWQFLFELGVQKPVFGHGFGTSRYAKWRWTYVNDTYMEWTREINNTETQRLAHNQHVQMFFELGGFGLAVFWLALLLILANGVRVTRIKNTPESFFLKMLLLSVCYHLLDSFSHDGLLSSGQPASYLFWMKAGVLVYGTRVLMRKRRVRLVTVKEDSGKRSLLPLGV